MFNDNYEIRKVGNVGESDHVIPIWLSIHHHLKYRPIVVCIKHILSESAGPVVYRQANIGVGYSGVKLSRQTQHRSVSLSYWPI